MTLGPDAQTDGEFGALGADAATSLHHVVFLDKSVRPKSNLPINSR